MKTNSTGSWCNMTLEECHRTIVEADRYFLDVLPTLEEGERICFTVDIRRHKDGYSTATYWEEEMEDKNKNETEPSNYTLL